MNVFLSDGGTTARIAAKDNTADGAAPLVRPKRGTPGSAVLVTSHSDDLVEKSKGSEGVVSADGIRVYTLTGLPVLC